MADDVDAAVEQEYRLKRLAIIAHRAAAARIPDGVPGDCDLCGEWSGRLVEGACAPCRDRVERVMRSKPW